MSNSFDIDFDMMKAIQIVVDEDLLRRVDRSAKKRKSSRSAAIRRLVELGLQQDGVAALARAEAEAYARLPPSRDDVSGFRALSRSQQRAMSDLARTDRW